ncbi:MAG: class I SAM-dependent methyltransferase [Phycisphaera sp. RhM]|nr:class I SAM-dependent methyltransferase [Phycisphaera sp. RhM]
MDLIELDFPVCWDTPPKEILRTIEIAERLRGQMKSDETQKRIPLLANSNYYIAYHALKHIRDTGLGGDLSFCEWGSGLGVVTCIASQLGFHVTGIEIEASLCEFSEKLARQADVDARFFQGSYRSPINNDISHLQPREGDRPFPLGRRNCDVIYAYPWPAEAAYLASLFVQSSASILVTYHGGTTLRVRKHIC